MSGFFPIPLSPRHPLIQMGALERSRSASPTTTNYSYASRGVSPLALSRKTRLSVSRTSLNRCDSGDSCDGFLSARSYRTESPYSRRASPEVVDLFGDGVRSCCTFQRRACDDSAPGRGSSSEYLFRRLSAPPLIPPSAGPVDGVNSFLTKILTVQPRGAEGPDLSRTESGNQRCGLSSSPCARHPVDDVFSFDPVLMWLIGREATGRRAVEDAERRCWASLSCHWALSRHLSRGDGSSTVSRSKSRSAKAKRDSLPRTDVNETIPYVEFGKLPSPPTTHAGAVALSRCSMNDDSGSPFLSSPEPSLLTSPSRRRSSPNYVDVFFDEAFRCREAHRAFPITSATDIRGGRSVPDSSTLLTVSTNSSSLGDGSRLWEMGDSPCPHLTRMFL